ncbi:MAG: enolase C-terminal domain-like protein [Negativicutes bacterium]|nr:enolase C-terminal domain-like protein [Negativicutes bacterium]
MQISKVEVTPVELKLRQPVRMAGLPAISHVTAVFVRLETRQGQNAWGCTIAHPQLTGEKPEAVIRSCRECAALVVDLHPLNIEYSLNELALRARPTPSVLCAFDLAFHDLLSLAAGMPLYRILGGYRNCIQTSATIPIAPADESVELARQRAGQGFRMLKIKGGLDPAQDVERVQAIHRALPNHVLRLDADGGYTVQQALDVARSLENILEMLEQPTPAQDLSMLRAVKELSPVRILADQSLSGAESALKLVTERVVDGLSIKLVTCGGLRSAQQIDTIARAAKMTSMISCFIEPALLICAGLSLALSSPNVAYGDLDGCLDLINDPSQAGFKLEDGWLIAADVPGLGYTVNLG